jgi:solute carrier family 25 phosphate transporter 23/24/25/41
MATPAGMADGFMTVARTEGMVALYKGLVPTLVGIAPYAALNFATYDLLKRKVYNAGDK